MIDADISALLTSVAGKAGVTHVHGIGDVSGLATALSGKAATDHNHALANLSDVSGLASAPNGYVLAKSGSMWVPASALSVLGNHIHGISDVTGLTEALDAKLTSASIAALSIKALPVDADSVPLVDSAASGALKRFSWANIKTALKSYFDGIYAPVASTVPPGVIWEFSGDVCPDGWYFAAGQAVSRTADAALFAAIGTKYGAGDGSTTFNLPDKRDRVSIGKGDMGGTDAGIMSVTLSGTRASAANGIITGLSSTASLAVGMKAFGTGIGSNAVIASIDSATQVTLSVNNSSTGSGSIRFALIDTLTLGATGGSAVHTLTVGQMPAHTHDANGLTNRNTVSGGSDQLPLKNGTANGIVDAVNSRGGGQAHPNVQPSIVSNFIIKR